MDYPKYIYSEDPPPTRHAYLIYSVQINLIGAVSVIE